MWAQSLGQQDPLGKEMGPVMQPTTCKSESESHSVMSDSLRPHGLYSKRVPEKHLFLLY